MKSEKRILMFFILNLVFIVFEFIGRLIIISVALLNDSVHDIGDSFSIESQKRNPNKNEKKR